MTPPARETGTPLQHKFFVALAVATTLAFVVVLAPYYGALMWGAIIALLFSSLYRVLLRRFGGRANWAAAATLLIVVVIVILPLATMAAALVQEGSRLVERVQSGQLNVGSTVERAVAVLPPPLADLLKRNGLGDMASIQQRIAASAGRAGQVLAGQALALGQNTLDFVVAFFVALYVAFFMLRDGRMLAERIRRAIPLRDAVKAELGEKFTAVVRATVKGNVVVAALQGALGGLAFWALGIHGALLWAVLMAFLSLLPAVGAALVWGPAALYLLATGAIWQGLALVAWGVLVIGLVDNVLRPLLVGKDTRLPDWLVLLSTIGGMAIFGINGFVIGPVVAAMFVAVWAIFGNAGRGETGPS